MTFERARNLIKGFLIAGIACCVAGLITQASPTPLSTVLVFCALACVVLCVFIAAIGLRCPYCGGRIIRDCLVVKVCPHCRRDLKSGLKVKSKKIR